jgi:hypothetical protein
VRDAHASGAVITKDDIESEIDVQVSFPGQPEDDVLNQFYQCGMLTYEAYINYMSTKHSIPIENFHKTPQLDLKELNGIQEPEPKPGKKT